MSFRDKNVGEWIRSAGSYETYHTKDHFALLIPLDESYMSSDGGNRGIYPTRFEAWVTNRKGGNALLVRAGSGTALEVKRAVYDAIAEDMLEGTAGAHWGPRGDANEHSLWVVDHLKNDPRGPFQPVGNVTGFFPRKGS